MASMCKLHFIGSFISLTVTQILILYFIIYIYMCVYTGVVKVSYIGDVVVGVQE